MTAAGPRIVALEQQVAGLAAQVEQLQRKAFVLKTLQEIPSEIGPVGVALQTAFDAGRASAREDTVPGAASRRPRHLHAVEARHA
jgi:hypothetical protein